MKKTFLCKMLLLMAVLLGFGFNAKAQVTFDYMPVSVTPANNSTLASLKQIEIATDVFWANLNTYSKNNVVNVYDQNGNVVTSGKLADDQPVKSNLVCSFEKEITATGVYTVVVPQNLFGDDEYFSKGFTTGRANPELTYTYTIGEDVVEIKGLPTSVDPADGSEIPSLTTIKLLFSPSDYPKALHKYSTPAELYNSSNKKIAEGTLDYTQGTSYYGITVTFDKIAEAGTYTVKIKEGTICEYQNTANKCPEIKLTYIVTGEEPEPEPELSFEVTWNPDPSITLESISKLDFTFDQLYADAYLLTSGTKPTILKDGVEVADVTVNLTGNEGGSGYLEFFPALESTGVYTIQIPEGAYLAMDMSTWAQTPIPAFEVTYTVESPYRSLPISITPADGETVEELSTIYLEFSHEDYPNTMDYAQNGERAKVYNEAGEIVSEGAYGITGDYWITYINLETPITTAGNYRIEIAAGHFKEYARGIDRDPYLCPAFSINYTVVPAKEIYGYIYVNDQMDKGVLTLAADGLEFAEEEIGSWNQEDLMTRSEAVTFNKRFAYSIVGELQASYDITYTWADGTVKESTFVLEGDMTDGYISFEGDSITGIEGIDAENGEVEYYNMQGVRVENPENGLYIRRQGNKTEKVYIRK